VEVGLLPVLVVAQPETVYFSLAGMETGLAALLLVGMLWCFLGAQGRPVVAAVLAGTLFTVRPGDFEIHGLRYRVVESFALGSGGTRWLLACRPG
jgi:hypothetical protein